MYNYLDDTIKIKFREPKDYKICSSENKNCIVRATVCGKCYQDPDIVSEKLYEDLSTVFNNSDFGKKYILKKIRHSSRLYLQYDTNYTHELSIDYIGPSRNNALSFLKGSDEDKAKTIGEFLLISRTIGGHVFWPAHRENRNMTINQIRGKRNGIYDRIDITLAELQNFYKTKGKGDAKFYPPLYDTFKRYNWFFYDCFGSFENYIDYMKLKWFLHGENVISLTESDIQKGEFKPVSDKCNNYMPSDYLKFISNCSELIKNRSEEMNGFLK